MHICRLRWDQGWSDHSRNDHNVTILFNSQKNAERSLKSLRADGNGTRAVQIWLRTSSQAQLLARSTSTPSFTMMGTMTRLATGSAHHQPSRAFNSKPPSRIADR